MRLYFESSASSTLVMEHHGEQIRWILSPLDKARREINYDPLAHINQFWAYLGDGDQTAIFEVYKKIRDTFFQYDNISELTPVMQKHVAELMSLHPISRAEGQRTQRPTVEEWVMLRSDIVFPDTFREKVGENDYANPQAKTYLKEDYKQLIVLALALRPMLPIWGEFLHRFGKAIGNDTKEMDAGKLLARSAIYHCIAMEKLRNYIYSFLDADMAKMAAHVVKFISSTDIPDWLLGLILVRRVSIGDLRGIDIKTNLVATIFKFMSPKLKGNDSGLAGVLKEKRIDGGYGDNKNEPSKLEGYKSKQALPIGDIEAILHDAEDVERICFNIAPDMPPEYLKMSLKTVEELTMHQIREPQIVMMQWVMSQKKQLPARGIPFLPKTILLRVAAATQALLWHRGFYDLAGLTTAVTIDTGDDPLMPSESRSRIRADQLEEMLALCPYSRRSSSRGKQNKPVSSAAEAVESLAALFNEHSWKLTLPPEWVEKLTGHKNDRRYSAPSDLRSKIADLSIAVAKRSF